MKHFIVADPKTLSLLNSYFIQKLLTLTLADVRKFVIPEILNISVVFKIGWRPHNPSKLIFLQKAIPFFYLLLLIFFVCPSVSFISVWYCNNLTKDNISRMGASWLTNWFLFVVYQSLEAAMKRYTLDTVE